MPRHALGPYRVGPELGSGGMGTVYAASVEDPVPGLATGSRVAVKVLHPHLLENPAFFERFLREAEIGKAVAHPNVVRTYDCRVLETGGERTAFLAMEYVEGQTLRELLDEIERVPEELCRHVGREIANGLAAIHAVGVIHRDLKPANVLITPDHQVKVMDLGVARLMDEVVRLSQTGSFVGSIHYSSPEQFGRGDDVDQRVDLHALGLVLYELSAAQHPYYDEDFRIVMHDIVHTAPRRVSAVNPQLTPFFEEVVHTLLEKDPDRRFGSAADVAHVLDAGESSTWWRDHAQALRAARRRPLRRIRIPMETAHYGRDAELGSLDGLFESAARGEGGVLLIEGEAGIGKSRLIDEFSARLAARGEDFNFLYGSYPPGGAATGSGAFSTAYREHFGEEGLEGTLGHYLNVTPLLAPAFAAVLSGDAAPEGALQLTRDSLQTVFVHVTRALAAERPTVVVIEDLHLTPEEGRAIFAALAMAVPGHRVLLIGTYRPQVPAGWVADVLRHENASLMTLPRLGPKDLMMLLRESFRSEPLARELGHQIAVKSDGNPFFAFEIIRGLREGRFIRQRGDGSWASTRVIEQIEIPSSVLDLINGWIADLDDEEKDLLDVASCCGFEFDPLLVAAALGMEQIPAMKRLARLERKHRLVRSVGRRFVFDHHQVREAIHDGLPPLLREPYHLAIAMALEARAAALATGAADLDGAVAVDLCEHFLAGAAGGRAVRYLTAALDHLEQGYLNDQAVALAGRFLAEPGLLEGVQRARVLVHSAARLEMLGRLDASRDALDEALPLVEAHGDAKLLAAALVARGQQMHQSGSYAPALPVLERAVEQARVAGERALEIRATANLGNIAFRQGRYGDAERLHETTLRLARESGARWGEMVAHGNRGNVLWSLGRTDEAADSYRRALELAEETGDRRAAASATGNLGNILHREGRYADEVEWHRRALAISQGIGNRQGQAINHINLAIALSALGLRDEARESAESAVRLARETGFALVEGHALGQLAQFGADSDDVSGTERRFRAAIEIEQRLGAREIAVSQMILFGAFLAAHGRVAEAREQLETAGALARESGLPGGIVLAACRLAQFPGGDAGEAAALLERHAEQISGSDRMEAELLLWRVTGDERHLRCAADRLDGILAKVPEEHHRAMREKVPLHREILEAASDRGA